MNCRQRQRSRASGPPARRPADGSSRAAPAGWFVYVLRCRDGTLYAGVTTDVERRRRQHDAGTAARYTRGRGPVAVVHLETHATRSAALRREMAVKRMTRAEKLRMVGGECQPVARRRGAHQAPTTRRA